MDLSEGTLLGGRISYRQPLEGYRTGIEPVLLAASVAAKPGERVLEAGTGAGAGLLCLLARVPGLAACGVERDGALATLAAENLRANGHETAEILTSDIQDLPALPPFDHAIANPPWHEANSSPSGDAMRDAAKRAGPGLLGAWAGALARCLRPGGSLTLVLPAASLPAALAGCAAASCGSPAIWPLWPRVGRSARLVLLQTLKARRGPCRLGAGLVLHEGCGYAPGARAILWDGQTIIWPDR